MSPGTEQRNDKMSLEYPYTVPASTEVHIQRIKNMSCQMARKIALRLSTGQSWHNFYKKLNNDQSKLLSMEHKKIDKTILIILRNKKVGGRSEDTYL